MWSEEYPLRDSYFMYPFPPECRFDVSLAHLELRRGEFLIDSMDSVEDTKVIFLISWPDIWNLPQIDYWIFFVFLEQSLAIGQACV